MNTVNLTFGRKEYPTNRPSLFGRTESKFGEQKAQRLKELTRMESVDNSIQANNRDAQGNAIPMTKETAKKVGIPIEGEDYIKDAQGNAHFPNKGFSIDDVAMSLQVEARNAAELKEQMLAKAVSELPLVASLKKIMAKFKI